MSHVPIIQWGETSLVPFNNPFLGSRSISNMMKLQMLALSGGVAFQMDIAG